VIEKYLLDVYRYFYKTLSNEAFFTVVEKHIAAIEMERQRQNFPMYSFGTLQIIETQRQALTEKKGIDESI